MKAIREKVELPEGHSFRVLRWSKSLREVECILGPGRTQPVQGEGNHWHFHKEMELTLFTAGVGTRAIAVGYPGGVNAAFDADLCNVALVWRGAFMDAKRHWTDRGDGFQPPLGYGLVKLDRNVPLTVLTNGEAAWPAAPRDLPNGDWPEGYRFGGYTLDKKGVPTFRYTFRGVSVEDRMEGAAADEHSGHDHAGVTLQRVITLRSKQPLDGLHLRLTTGSRLTTGKDGVFPLDEDITLHAAGGIVRKSAGGPELLVPVSFNQGVARVAVTYRWNH